MQGVNYLIPLITLPYLTRVLGGYQYGVLSTALVFAQYVILVVDFGFNLSATKKISEQQNNIAYINKVYWHTIISKAVLFVISLTISLTVIISINKYHSILLIYIYCLPQVIGSIIFPVWLFQGIEKIKLISILTIIPKLLVIPLLFLFVKKNNDVVNSALILSMPLFFSAVLSVFVVRRLGIKRIKEISLKSIVLYIDDSFHYFIGSVAISVYTLSTPIILSWVSSYQEVGYYSAADKLRAAMLGVFLILGQAIYPRANSLMANSKCDYYIFLRKLIKYQVVFCSITAVLFYFVMPTLAPFVLGASFSHIGILLKVMSPMIVIIPLSVILANCIILPHGKSRAYAFIPWGTAILHIPYAYFLCKSYGALGGSVAILITEIFSFLVLFVYCFNMGFLKKVLWS